MRSNPVRHYRRRRSVRHSSRRRRVGLRRYRRNPGLSLAGLNLAELLKGAGAVILAPILEKQIMPLLPATVSGTSYGRWAVKLGAALGTWYVAKAAFGRRSADVVAIALGSNLIADAVDEFFPVLTAGFGAYSPRGMRAYSRPLLNGRGLGMVTSGQVSRGMHGTGASRFVSVGAGTPDVFRPPF